jgi:hypothetical protein
VTDSPVSDKAAAAVDSAADAVKDAATSATTSVQKTTEAAAAEAAKAADATKAATAKAADATKAATAKAADATKAATTKAAETTKATTAKTVDAVKTTTADAKASVTKAVDDKAAAKPAPPRTAAEIEADLDAVRARLAGRINDLEDYVAPKNVAKRGVNSVKSIFVDEYGGVKPDRVLMAVGAVVLLVGLRAVGRRRRNG